MKKTFITTLLIIAVLGIIVSGCTESTPEPAPAPAQTPAQTQEPAPAPEPEPAPAPAETIDLKFIYHFTSQGSTHSAMLVPWAEAVEEATGGRVTITSYPGATLVGQEDEYDAVESGLADMACIIPSPGRFPLSEIVSLPKLFPSAEISGRVYNELLDKYTADSEFKNVKILWVVSFPLQQLVSTKPVNTIEDFKGMKMWTISKVEGWMGEKLGTSGVNLPTADIYNSLERGLLDGLFFAWEGSFFLEFFKVTDYRTETNMFTRAYPIVMNLDTWNSLPADIQAIFEEMSGPDVSAQYSGIYDKSEMMWRDKIAEIDKGMGKDPIIFLSAEEEARWQEYLKPIWTQWVDEMNEKGNTNAQAMLDDAVRLSAEYSK